MHSQLFKLFLVLCLVLTCEFSVAEEEQEEQEPPVPLLQGDGSAVEEERSSVETSKLIESDRDPPTGHSGSATNSNEEEEEEEPSFIGLFSGLLETLTETKESKDCPGQCVHTFRALICEATLENSACPGNMKCCVENPTNETESNHHPPPHHRHPPPPPHWNNNRPNWHYNYQPGYNGPPYHGPPPPPYRGPPSGSPSQPQPPQGQGQPVWQNSNNGPPNNNWPAGPPPNPPNQAGFHPVTPTPIEEETKPTPMIVTPESSSNSKPVVVVQAESLGKKEEIVKHTDSIEDDELEPPILVTKPHTPNQDSTTEATTIKPAQTCPGVCVAQRMTIYCDGLYNGKNICANDLKCCITHEYYINNHRTNQNLLLIKANDTAHDGATIQDDELELEQAAAAVPPMKPMPSAPAPTPTQAPKPTKSKPKLPPCPGQCVNPLLTFFCNNINNNFHCEGENSCCMNNGTDNEGPGHPGSAQPMPIPSSPDGSQVPPPPQQQPPPQNLRPQEDNCPRVCLPNNLYSRCPKVLRFNCIEGYFCCVSPPYNAYPMQQHPGNYPPPPPPPQGQGQGQGQGQHSGPPPQNQGPPPSKPNTKPTPPQRNSYKKDKISTTTSKSKIEEDEIYDDESPLGESEEAGALSEKLLINCPGSCINTILSFTCFRNAEITDLFLCNKANTKCCAPKTAIKEYLDSINATTTTTPSVQAQADKVMKPHISSKSPSGAHLNHLNYNPVPPSPQPPLPLAPIMQNPHNNMYNPPAPVPNQQQIPNMQPPPPPISNYPQNNLSPSIPLPLNPPSPLLPQQPVVILPQVKPSMNIYNKIPNFNKYVCGVKGNANPGGEQQQPHPTVPGTSSRVKRVVGGEDSEPGEWCWQIALINNLNQYLCGGALIGTQWVLTAAHCVTNIIRSGDTIYVRVGDYDLTSKYGSPGAQTLRVQTTYIHHNHNSQTLDNDIALLKLQGQINLKEGVCLVCLPARSGSNNELYNSNKRCTVTGYGYMGESGPIPLRIREATLPIVPETECIRKINAVTEKIFVLPTSSFCAGGELRNDACQGDGGGPLVCMDNGFYELTGLVSWGFGCGRENVPGVYVKVSSFIGWINQIISVNN